MGSRQAHLQSWRRVVPRSKPTSARLFRGYVWRPAPVRPRNPSLRQIVSTDIAQASASPVSCWATIAPSRRPRQSIRVKGQQMGAVRSRLLEGDPQAHRGLRPAVGFRHSGRMSNTGAWDSSMRPWRTPMPAAARGDYSTPAPAGCQFLQVRAILTRSGRGSASPIRSTPRRCFAPDGESTTSSSANAAGGTVSYQRSLSCGGQQPVVRSPGRPICKHRDSGRHRSDRPGPSPIRIVYPALGTVGSMRPTVPDGHQNRPPRINQFSVGFQREITRSFVMEATYVGNRVVWLPGPLGELEPNLPAAIRIAWLVPLSWHRSGGV